MAQQGPAAPPTRTGTPGTRPSGGVIASLVGAAVLVVFMVQNRQLVTVHLWAWYVTWPLWLVVLLSAALGAVVWLGAGVLRRRRRRRARRAADGY